MQRILTLALTVILLTSPVVVAAQETPAPENPEVATTTPETLPDYHIPVFLFADESGGVLGVVPLADDLFLWAYATTTDGALIGFTSPQGPEFADAASTESEDPPITLLGVLLVPLDSNGALPEQFSDSGAGVVQRKYSNHEFDRDTALTYGNARYYNQGIGRFISQDNLASRQPEKVLQDPQQLNTYAYARNNPLIHIDPTGNNAVPAMLYVAAANPAVSIGASIIVGGIGFGAYNLAQSINYLIQGDSQRAQQISEAGVITIVTAGLTGTMTLVSGLMQATQGQEKAQVGDRAITQERGNTPALLNPSIKMDNGRLQSHVYPRHVDMTRNLDASKFNAGEDVEALIKQGTQQPMTLRPNGNYVRNYDVGRNIGTDRGTSEQTSRMTVVTYPNQSLNTSFPGDPIKKQR